MARRALPLVAILLLLGGAPRASAEDAPPTTAPAGAIPFPTNRTQTLRGAGKTFVVDGHVVIPKKVEIGVEWGTKIIGINGARLEVAGGLKVRGTMDHWVQIHDIDFSPTVSPHKGFHLDMVDMERCRFAHAEDAPFEGTCTIENTTLQSGCVFDFRIRKGKLNLLTTVWRETCHIRCVPPEGERPKILVQVRSSEFRTKVSIEGAGDATFRHNAHKGGLSCERVGTLVVDGCDIHDGLSVRQPADGTFKKVTLSKCNIWNGAGVVLHRDAGEDQKKEKVFLQKFYFGSFDGSDPITDADAIEALVKVGPGALRVRLDKPRKKKHLLVNYDIWMTRPPQLR